MSDKETSWDHKNSDIDVMSIKEGFIGKYFNLYRIWLSASSFLRLKVTQWFTLWRCSSFSQLALPHLWSSTWKRNRCILVTVISERLINGDAFDQSKSSLLMILHWHSFSLLAIFAKVFWDYRWNQFQDWWFWCLWSGRERMRICTRIMWTQPGKS